MQKLFSGCVIELE